jgi:hypothetical protein
MAFLIDKQWLRALDDRRMENGWRNIRPGGNMVRPASVPTNIARLAQADLVESLESESLSVVPMSRDLGIYRISLTSRAGQVQI